MIYGQTGAAGCEDTRGAACEQAFVIVVHSRRADDRACNEVVVSGVNEEMRCLEGGACRLGWAPGVGKGSVHDLPSRSLASAGTPRALQRDSQKQGASFSAQPSGAERPAPYTCELHPIVPIEILSTKEHPRFFLGAAGHSQPGSLHLGSPPLADSVCGTSGSHRAQTASTCRRRQPVVVTRARRRARPLLPSTPPALLTTAQQSAATLPMSRRCHRRKIKGGRNSRTIRSRPAAKPASP